MSIMKVVRNITLDADVWETCRVANENISKLCNDYLKYYFDSPEQYKAKKEQETEKVVHVFEALKQKGLQDEELDKLLRQAKVMRACYDPGFNRFLKDASSRFHIDWIEMIRRMEKL